MHASINLGNAVCRLLASHQDLCTAVESLFDGELQYVVANAEINDVNNPVLDACKVVIQQRADAAASLKAEAEKLMSELAAQQTLVKARLDEINQRIGLSTSTPIPTPNNTVDTPRRGRPAMTQEQKDAAALKRISERSPALAASLRAVYPTAN